VVPAGRQIPAGQAFTGVVFSPPPFLPSRSCLPKVVDGEVYPPVVTDAPVHMVYPPDIPKEKQLAMGQEVFGLLPGLCLYATLWLREHNRVCDVLKREHPTWSDEQLFQTARLILIGEDRQCRRARAPRSPVSHLPGQAPRSWVLVSLCLRVVARLA